MWWYNHSDTLKLAKLTSLRFSSVKLDSDCKKEKIVFFYLLQFSFSLPPSLHPFLPPSCYILTLMSFFLSSWFSSSNCFSFFRSASSPPKTSLTIGRFFTFLAQLANWIQTTKKQHKGTAIYTYCIQEPQWRNSIVSRWGWVQSLRSQLEWLHTLWLFWHSLPATASECG